MWCTRRCTHGAAEHCAVHALTYSQRSSAAPCDQPTELHAPGTHPPLTATPPPHHHQLRSQDVHIGEYLYIHRAGALPLLGREWELRYIVLSGNVLRYYRDQRDATVFNPQEELSLAVRPPSN